MAIHAQCFGCGQQCVVDDALAGHQLRCRVCGTVTTVPDPAAVLPMLPPPPGAALPPPLPPPVVRAAIPLPTPPESILPFYAWHRIRKLVFCLMFVGGMILAALLGREAALSYGASRTPQTISCLALENNGPGANRYVRLVGFACLQQGYAYWRNGGDAWEKVLIPVVAANGPFAGSVRTGFATGKYKVMKDVPPPPRIKVMLRASQRNKEEVDALVEQKSVEGLIVNRVESLEDAEAQTLKGMYPSTDFSNCWIIGVAKKPMAMPISWSLALLGAGMGVSGLILLITSGRQR